MGGGKDEDTNKKTDPIGKIESSGSLRGKRWADFDSDDDDDLPPSSHFTASLSDVGGGVRNHGFLMMNVDVVSVELKL